jgi:hypothetical protein
MRLLTAGLTPLEAMQKYEPMSALVTFRSGNTLPTYSITADYCEDASE